MSFLFSKKSKTAATSRTSAPTIRVEKVATKPALEKRIAILKNGSNKIRLASPSAAASRRSPDLTSDDSLKSRTFKQRPRKRSPAIQRVESDSSEDGDSTTSFEILRPRKKARNSFKGRVDLKRNLCYTESVATDTKDLEFINAADIANLEQKFIPAFGASAADVSVKLRYPGLIRRERYDLVYKNGEFDPVEEIFDVVKDFTKFFLKDEQADLFTNPETGIIRRLERSKNIKSMQGFKSAVDTYNAELKALSAKGSLMANIRNVHSLPLHIVNRVTKQVYDRSVSPNVDLLKKYENGTDFIYGELKTVFVYDILVETGITSDQVFVDLGSGVANVVVQAALQIGCESWGCEIMENACVLADAQKKEFEARCRLWGIAPGKVRLERGDFMLNDSIREALTRADVVLVNNEVFTPELNNGLVNLFLDLKDGCQIVSLKSFVPHNHKITSYNHNNPVNLLEVEQKIYSSQSVSWKDEGGNYFISKKDSKRLQAYGHLT